MGESEQESLCLYVNAHVFVHPDVLSNHHQSSFVCFVAMWYQVLPLFKYPPLIDVHVEWKWWNQRFMANHRLYFIQQEQSHGGSRRWECHLCKTLDLCSHTQLNVDCVWKRKWENSPDTNCKIDHRTVLIETSGMKTVRYHQIFKYIYLLCLLYSYHKYFSTFHLTLTTFLFYL